MTEDVRTKGIVTLLLLIIPISGIGIDIYLPSLPNVVSDLYSTDQVIKSSLSLYLLGFCLGQFVVGFISDCFGRRLVLITGMVLLAIVSILNSTSNSTSLYLFTRFLQGVLVAVPVIIAKAVASDCFVGEKLKKISTYFVLSWSLGPIFAPLIGGALQHSFGWRSIGLCMAAFCFTMVLYSSFILPETNKSTTKFNANSIMLSYASVFRSNRFIAGSMCLSIVYSFIIIFSVFSPFYIQKQLKISAITFSHIVILMGMGCFLGSLFNRLLVVRFSTQQLITLGFMLSVIASIMLFVCTIFGYSSLFILLVTSFFIYTSVGIIFPNLSAVCMGMFPDRSGVAMAILGVINILGTAFFSFLISIFNVESVSALAICYLLLNCIFFIIYKKYLWNTIN